MPARPLSRLLAVTGLVSLAATVAVAVPANAVAASTGTTPAATTSTAAAASAAASLTTLHFAVTVGDDDTTRCDVVGDLYTPAGASPSSRVPAVLMTDGFGGSKDGVAPMATMFARLGYAVLAYSGLGFGGSTCPVSMDDPQRDGKAAEDLVSYLGGADGIAYEDAAHTEAAPTLDIVTIDRRAHDGTHHRNDPRVGMVGGSYGGAVQLAAASVDPRIDAIVPTETWNDLSYSLFPNGTATTTGVSSTTPGAMKIHWGLTLGLLASATGTGVDGTRPAALLGCEHTISAVCQTLVHGALQGYPSPSDLAALHRVSPVSYLEDVRVPTLLIQGERDTLFNLNEATATFETLRAQGTPTAMIWQRSGHTESEPAAGDIDWSAPDPAQYTTGRMVDWIAHYVRGADVGTGPLFAYYRDWADDDTDPTGAAAFAASDTFPVADADPLYLSSGGHLVHDPRDIIAGTWGLVTPALGLPTSADPTDILDDLLDGSLGTGAEADAPGTSLQWTTGALDASLDIAGSPTLDLTVSSPGALLTQTLGARGELVLFVKVLDVAPDGSAALVGRQVTPVRIPDASRSFTTRLPGLVHRFEAGHRIRVVVASGSANYRGGLFAHTVTVTTGSAGQVLTLPRLDE